MNPRKTLTRPNPHDKTKSMLKDLSSKRMEIHASTRNLLLKVRNSSMMGFSLKAGNFAETSFNSATNSMNGEEYHPHTRSTGNDYFDSHLAPSDDDSYTGTDADADAGTQKKKKYRKIMLKKIFSRRKAKKSCNL